MVRESPASWKSYKFPKLSAVKYLGKCKILRIPEPYSMLVLFLSLNLHPVCHAIKILLLKPGCH